MMPSLLVENNTKKWTGTMCKKGRIGGRFRQEAKPSKEALRGHCWLTVSYQAINLAIDFGND